MARAALPLMMLAWLIPWTSSTANADVVIEIESTTILPLGTASVDVFARSSDATLIDIAGFDLQFEISLNPFSPSPSGAVEFRPGFDDGFPTDPARQNNNEQQASNYIFFNLTTIGNFVATRLSTVELFAGDSTRNLGNYTNVALGSDRVLIARLELQQVQAPETTAATGVYDIRLSTTVASSYYSADGITLNINSGLSTAGAAVVTAVPEASAIAFMAAAVVMSASYYIGRRRKFGRAVKQ